MERLLEVKIDEQLAGKDIRHILKVVYGTSSRLLSRLKLRRDAILLNNKSVYVSAVVQVGDVLKVRLEEADDTSPGIVATKGTFCIVYEDEDVLLVNKHAGVDVHPSMGNYTNTLANYVAYYFQQQGKKLTFRAVNRLDKNTSGLMLIAKNQFSHGVLSSDLQNGKLRRGYMALTQGEILEAQGTIEAPIARVAESVIKRGVCETGQYARTDYTVLSASPACTLVDVRPKTGRTHQIRVHFAHIGHPLVGDFLYGVEDVSIIPRHALHAHAITFYQPITKKPMSFEIELAPDIITARERLLTKLKGGDASESAN